MRWALIVKAMYKHGRPVTSCELELLEPSRTGSRVRNALDSARLHHMVTNDRELAGIEPRGGHDATKWQLTPLGVAYAEGRVCQNLATRSTTRGRPSRVWGLNWVCPLYPTVIPHLAAHEQTRQLELFT